MVVFLLFAILQLFAINSLDQYSSGVTLQAVGMRVKRYQAVAIDSVVRLVVTLYAVLHSSFSTYLKDFVAVVIVWIAPWVAVYLVDWVLRRYRYVPGELQKTGPDGLYYGRRGVSLAGAGRPAARHVRGDGRAESHLQRARLGESGGRGHRDRLVHPGRLLHLHGDGRGGRGLLAPCPARRRPAGRSAGPAPGFDRALGAGPWPLARSP